MLKTEATKKARQWIESKAGRDAVREVIERSKRAQSRLSEARRVDLATLRVPVNVW